MHKRQELKFHTWKTKVCLLLWSYLALYNIFITFKHFLCDKAQRLHCDKSISDDLYALACGLHNCAHSCSGYIANGVRFDIKNHDSRWITHNSGVMVPGEDESSCVF